MNTKVRWIWQQPEWPNFFYDPQLVSTDVAEAYRMHGLVEGKAAALGLNNLGELVLDAFAGEAFATAAIEGERLPMESVRSSVMRRMGLATTGPASRHIDGLVAVLADATTAFDVPLDEGRLCRWQAALFPGGASGIRKIVVGNYRNHADPMQLVSGPQGHEIVHYEAPPSKAVPEEMRRFLAWFAETSPRGESLPGRAATSLDGFARAAMAHAWFESIHPFEDGNGRIGRAIVDMAIAQQFRQPIRLYSLSRQLKTAPKDYYDALNQVQRGSTVDVTAWVKWFARQCAAACQHTSLVMDAAIEKRQFWELHKGSGLQDRQRKVLQRLLDDGDGGFLGGLNAEKYIRITGVSKATATRDLAQMVADAQLWSHGAGKAVRYYINMPGWTHGVQRDTDTGGSRAVGEMENGYWDKFKT